MRIMFNGSQRGRPLDARGPGVGAIDDRGLVANAVVVPRATVTSMPTLDFDDVIERAVALELRDPGDNRWRSVLVELLPGVDDCRAFVEWATHHPTWLHNVADVADRVCAKPLEAAIFILSDIVDERLDDEAASGAGRPDAS